MKEGTTFGLSKELGMKLDLIALLLEKASQGYANANLEYINLIVLY